MKLLSTAREPMSNVDDPISCSFGRLFHMSDDEVGHSCRLELKNESAILGFISHSF